MEVRKASLEDVFKKYTRLSRDRTCFIIDVRPYKDWKRRHLLLSYCVRLSANAKALVDYSKNRYDQKWAQQVWWNTDVIVIGEEGLKRDHEVPNWMAKEGKCHSVSVCRDGIGAIEKAYPFLVGQSLNAHRDLVYPSRIASHLFLGNWANASDQGKVKDLGIRRVISIHNDPKKLKLPAGVRHMAITAPDLPTSDIAQYFAPTFAFIEEGLSAQPPLPVLVHCGAGSSRSAAICAAYLMRKHRWPAARALLELLCSRSSVCPNEGFWRQLCAFEEVLGLAYSQRSDADAPPVVSEAYGDLGDVRVPSDAAGARVRVAIHSAPGKRERDEGAGGPDAVDGEKKPRREGSGMRVTVKIDVQKHGEHVGSMDLPDMRPLQTCTFGRGSDADVPLEHASLSRAHAQLAVGLRGELQLTDLGSVHGTNVDGAWVKPKQPKVLQVGAKFRLGASSRTYCIKQINMLK